MHLEPGRQSAYAIFDPGVCGQGNGWNISSPLRAELATLDVLSNGRLIFGLDYTDADFEAVLVRFLAAARAMERDGWWWSDGRLSNRDIGRSILRELIASRFRPGPGRGQAPTASFGPMGS